MGKIVKEKISKKSIKILNTNQTNKSLCRKFNLKDCRIVLSELVTRNIDIKLSKSSLAFNGKIVHPIENKSNSVTFNLNFNPNLNQLLNDHCNFVHKQSSQKEPSKKNIAKSIAELADEKWRQVKRQQQHKKKELRIGEMVLSKMRTYAPWPSKILSFSKDGKRAQVFFYGTDNSGSVNMDEIVQFKDTTDVVRLLLRRNMPFFSRGVKTIEHLCGIPDELSLLREFAAIDN